MSSPDGAPLRPRGEGDNCAQAVSLHKQALAVEEEFRTGLSAATFDVLNPTGDHLSTRPRPRPRRRAPCAALLLALGGGLLAALIGSPLRYAADGKEAARHREPRAAASAPLGGSTASATKRGGMQEGAEDSDPSAEYEALRHRIYSNTQDLWSYLNSELSAALKATPNVTRLRTALDQLRDRKSSLLADQQALWVADGRAAEREAEARAVSGRLQARLRRLQHPPDCRAAKKLLCHLTKVCGFGCQIHHLSYCLVLALATRRVLVVRDAGWHYAPGGWARTFRPLSDSCAHIAVNETVETQKILTDRWLFSSTAPVLELPRMVLAGRMPSAVPPALPADLADRIARFTGDPVAWWAGQLLRYILRPQPAARADVAAAAAALNYTRPIVGMHIRRTDKLIREAQFHPLSEYMAHAQEHWRQWELCSGAPPPHRVFLASDDPTVLDEARAQYPNVTWLSEAAPRLLPRRYSPAALPALLRDLVLLSQADFLVCTFTSNMCRIVYELMLSYRVDAPEAVVSVDDVFHFHREVRRERYAVLPHEPNNEREVALEVNDVISNVCCHHGGFATGWHIRTNKSGLFPWYKTQEKIRLYFFPQSDECDESGAVDCLFKSHELKED